jgi:hypothetical protein
VNGRRLRVRIPGSDFSNWDAGHHLVLGNEATGNRPWFGKLFLVGTYNRALSSRKIEHNFAAGPNSQADINRRGAVALFDFEGV